jgi:hypothetical protein
MLAIFAFEQKFNGASKAQEIIKAQNAEGKSHCVTLRHRIGEALDGREGPPAREVHKDVCLHGD